MRFATTSLKRRDWSALIQRRRSFSSIERTAAEKAVVVYREKTTEATTKVLSETAIGTPKFDGPPSEVLKATR